MKNKIFAGLLLLYAIALCQFEISLLPNFGIDWHGTYYPSTMLLLHLQNPYSVTTLHNPVWALFPLIPFALIGEQAGKIALFFASFLAYVYVAWKLRASSVAIILYMASPLVIYNLMLGNVDWLVMIGFTMHPLLGLFFVLLKPQIGIGVAIYWLWTSYKHGGVKSVGKTFIPVIISMAISFFLFGNWLVGKSDNLLSAPWNLSLFPYSIPLGLILLYLARNNMNRAISASPFFSPYMSFGSWSIVQLGLVDNNLVAFSITTGLWMLYALLSRTP